MCVVALSQLRRGCFPSFPLQNGLIAELLTKEERELAKSNKVAIPLERGGEGMGVACFKQV